MFMVSAKAIYFGMKLERAQVFQVLKSLRLQLSRNVFITRQPLPIANIYNVIVLM